MWFDAPIGYLGITKQWADEKPGERNWKDWWLDAKDVYYVQFMGKDNVPFHSISFPATLLGTGENWTKVDYLKGMSYLTFEGGKFSNQNSAACLPKTLLRSFRRITGAIGLFPMRRKLRIPALRLICLPAWSTKI